MPSIRPVAQCLLVHENKVLLQEILWLGHRIMRPPGGGIDFGEHSVEAVRREIMEEVGSHITEPELLLILEHPRKLADLGYQQHEIIFMYKARLLREELHHLDMVPLDDNGHPGRAYWYSLDQLLQEKDILIEPPLLPKILAERVF